MAKLFKLAGAIRKLEAMELKTKAFLFTLFSE
jgi:hypothetical protein